MAMVALTVMPIMVVIVMARRRAVVTMMMVPRRRAMVGPGRSCRREILAAGRSAPTGEGEVLEGGRIVAHD
jgi:hypothetical protein